MDDPAPPTELPEEVADALTSLSATQLRELIEYAQSRLRFLEGPISEFIEPADDEEILRVEDYGYYAVVVKRGGTGEGGESSTEPPHVYVVTIEPEQEGGRHLHWADLGRVIE